MVTGKKIASEISRKSIDDAVDAMEEKRQEILGNARRSEIKKARRTVKRKAKENKEARSEEGEGQD